MDKQEQSPETLHSLADVNEDHVEALMDYGIDDNEQRVKNIAAFLELPGTEGASDYIGGPPHQAEQDHFYDDLPTNCIRLLRILPDNISNVIRCELRHFVLDTRLEYAALSYTWGRGPDVDNIIVNSRNVRVRKNLWRFLRQARAFVPSRFDWLWVDAICINQNDNRERMHQVELMAKIFQAASSVIVWLGPGYGGSEGALDYFSSRRAREPKRGHPNIHLGRVASIGMASLCYRPYWRRLWILQEIVFARRIWLMCGDRISPWQPFRDVLLRIQASFAVPTSAHPKHSRLGDCFESTSILNSPAMTIVALTEQRTHSRSLHVLLFKTKFLQCADQLDKVYALLSIAGTGCGDIQPDYDAAVDDLLNAVLRNFHKSKSPQSLEKVVNQCDALEELFDLEQSSMFRRNAKLDVSAEQPATNRSVVHFGPSGNPVTWWWILAHGHAQLEHAFWHEFTPDIPSFYHEAAAAGDLSALEVLFARAEFDVYFDKHNDRPLRLAARNGHADVVRLLLYKGLYDGPNAGPFLDSRSDRNALYSAISEGHLAVVEELTNASAQLDAADFEGITPLVYAVIHGDMAMVKLLLDHGANVDGGAEGISLCKSAEYGLLEIFELLLHRGAYFAVKSVVETTWQSKEAYGLMRIVMDFGHHQIQSFAGDMRIVIFIAMTLRHLCEVGRTGALEILLNSRDLRLLREDDRRDILTDVVLEAARLEHWKIVRSLLDHGADVNVNKHGNSMLHLATLQGDVPAVKMLLAKGVDVQREIDPSLANSTSYQYYMFEKPVTALKIAQRRKYTEIEDILLANIHARSVESKKSRKRRRSCSSPSARASFKFLCN
jgi:ankyrin repeat protein